MGLVDSPYCPNCNEIDAMEHFICVNVQPNDLSYYKNCMQRDVKSDVFVVSDKNSPISQIVAQITTLSTFDQSLNQLNRNYFQ